MGNHSLHGDPLGLASISDVVLCKTFENTKGWGGREERKVGRCRREEIRGGAGKTEGGGRQRLWKTDIGCELM